MTKIDIISGFLGAGKTTLIKKLLAEAYAGEKLVLIENEFGEISIDGGFLKESGVQVSEMSSGCICCSLVGDFGEALKEVYAQFQPDRILIEPSGVGKLSDVILAVENTVAEGGEMKLNSYVTVADATKVKVYMKNFGEFYNNQIEAAGTIILSRTQKLSQEKLEAAVALLREKNADAAILTTPWDQLDGKTILSAVEKVSLADELLEKLHHEHEHHHHEHDEHCTCGCHDHDHDHAHHHHHDHDDECHEHHHHDDECCHHDHEHDHEHEHHHEHDHEHHHDHDHDHAHHHHHASMADITGMIDGLDLPEKVKEDAKAVYGIIAEAESRVHGHPVTEIHFHEVGKMDAVADVVGVCLLMHEIGAEKIVASPVHVGSGYVRCAHGILPVPAPATALILEGIPTYGGAVRGELCTPTGAALLKHFAASFGDRPVMAVQAIGYGMGKKDFERANCVRAFLGESEGERTTITKLECNIDDMTAEDMGFAMEQLLAAGARDVYTQAIGMKKCRPGVLLNVLCLPEDADRMAQLMMKHTTTLGIRRQDISRYMLNREMKTVHTEYGDIRVKCASGMGVERAKAEYEDVAKLAREHQVSLAEIRKAIR